MKVFSTQVHGVLDYLTVLTLPTLPRLFGWDAPTTRFCDGAALAVLAYSLTTNYEMGAAKMLPMKTHLALDAALGATLLAAAARREDTDQAAQAILAGLGLFSLFASASTETTSGTETEQISFVESLGHA